MKKMLVLFVVLALMLCACGATPEAPQSEGKPINKETTAPADNDATKPTENLPMATPTTPETTPETAPATTPETVPETTPETAPVVTPEKTPTEPDPTKPTEPATTPHTHSYTAKVTAPTCTEQGYTTYTCKSCSASYKDNYVNAKGHTPTQWETVTFPNPFETGTAKRICTTCRATETTTLPKVQGYDGTVFYSPNNTAMQAGNENLISFNPRCAYWKDGALIVQGWMVNDFNRAVEVNKVDSILINNGSVNIAYGENIEITNGHIDAKSIQPLVLSFSGNAIANYGASLDRLKINADIIPIK